jgi:hypothetical protein
MRRIFAFISLIVMLIFPVSTHAQVSRLDIDMLVNNYSAAPNIWEGLVRVRPGETAEFKADIFNRGTEVARNVQVWIELGPSIPSPQPTVKFHARADNQPEVTGTSSVIINMAQDLGNLVLRPGSAIGGVGAGRPINLGTQPVGVGDLPPGPNPIQVRFLADVVVAPTPTSTPISTPTIHPTTTPYPTHTPYPTQQQVLGAATTVTPIHTPFPKVTATPAPVTYKKELPPKTPDTGFSSPAVGLAVSSMGGIGLLLRLASRKFWI